jgi:hypothetical protein
MQSPENVVDRRSARKNDAATAGYDTGGKPRKRASGGKKCRPFPSKQPKL